MSDQYRTSVQKTNFEGVYDASSVVVTVAGALAIYSSLEMVLLIAMTFKKWRGLYFWSLSMCNLGVLMYAIGFMMVYFELSVLWFSKTLNDLGWALMIVFQSLVLYSRLGLIVFDDRILKAVKWMIIVNSVVLIPFPNIFDFGTTFTDLSVFPRGYFYIEHIQVTVFSLQECIISGLYVVRTIALLKVIQTANTRGVVWQLMVINLIIIPMDVAIIVCQFKKLQLFQEAIKVFVYAVKLKLELNILSKLIDFIHDNDKQRVATLEIIDADSIAGQGQVSIRRESMVNDLHKSDTVEGKKATDVKRMNGDQTHSHQRSYSTANPSIDNNDSNAVFHSSRNIDNITESSPQHARASQRLQGRDSDILYADVIRSLG